MIKTRQGSFVRAHLRLDNHCPVANQIHPGRSWSGKEFADVRLGFASQLLMSGKETLQGHSNSQKHSFSSVSSIAQSIA